MSESIYHPASQHSDARKEWERRIAGLEAAREEHKRHDKILGPISDQLDRVAPYPGCSFDVPTREGRVASFNFFPADLHALDEHPGVPVRVKAAELRGKWHAHLAARSELGYDTASEESERLCNAMCEREGELLEMPAPDREALLWKLDRLFGPDTREQDDFCASWCPQWINAMMDDARRLLASPVDAVRIAEYAQAA